MNSSGIEPLDLKVLVRPKAAEKLTAGGIIVPDAVADRQKYAVTEGVLVAAGDNAFDEWLKGKHPSQVITPKVGDRVLHAQYAGARVKGEDGEDYLLMNDEDVVAVLAIIKEEA